MKLPYLQKGVATCTLAVSVRPKARQSHILGLHGGDLRVALDAPPVDGRANEALMEFLADYAGVARSQVSLRRGAASRHKLVQINGLDPDVLETKLIADGFAVSQPVGRES